MPFTLRPAGFAGHRISWRHAVLATLAVLLLAGTIVAVVRAGGDDGDSAAAGRAGLDPSAGSDDMQVAEDGAVVGGGEARSTADEATDADQGFVRSPVPGTSPAAGVGPRIVHTADMQIRVKGSFRDAFERATAVATTTGGYVTSSATSSFEKGRANGELTLRVPAARFDEARRRLADLGTLESAQTGGQDVGGELVDLDARLRTLRAEESALNALLERSTDIGQILQVRDRLTGVRTEIEQLDGRKAVLEDQVAMATIHVSLREAGAKAGPAKADGDDSGLLDSFGTAVDAAEAVVGGMVIVLGAMLPFVVLGLLAWPFARRHLRRRSTAPASP